MNLSKTKILDCSAIGGTSQNAINCYFLINAQSVLNSINPSISLKKLKNNRLKNLLYVFFLSFKDLMNDFNKLINNWTKCLF